MRHTRFSVLDSEYPRHGVSNVVYLYSCSHTNFLFKHFFSLAVDGRRRRGHGWTRRKVTEEQLHGRRSLLLFEIGHARRVSRF